MSADPLVVLAAASRRQDTAERIVGWLRIVQAATVFLALVVSVTAVVTLS